MPSPWAILTFGGIIAFFSVVVYGSTADGPRWDWAAPNGGWCCAKPRKWCRDATVCAQESVGGNFHYCARYEQAVICTDLCDDWRKEPGGRGGTCTPAAKPSNTCTP